MFIPSNIIVNLPSKITYENFLNYLNEISSTTNIDNIYQSLNKATAQELPWGQLDLLYHKPTNIYKFEIPRWDLSSDYIVVSRITQTPRSTLLPKSNFHSIAQEIADLLADKNEQYGSAFQTVPQILSILYPSGITPQDYQNALTLTRILDKVQRIATNNGNDPEDPWRDIAGYAILQLSKQNS